MGVFYLLVSECSSWLYRPRVIASAVFNQPVISFCIPFPALQVVDRGAAASLLSPCFPHCCWTLAAPSVTPVDDLVVLLLSQCRSGGPRYPSSGILIARGVVVHEVVRSETCPCCGSLRAASPPFLPRFVSPNISAGTPLLLNSLFLVTDPWGLQNPWNGLGTTG